MVCTTLNLAYSKEHKLYHKMSYSLVVILELDSVLEVQYKEIIIIGDE